jgi:hypothetical protein
MQLFWTSLFECSGPELRAGGQCHFVNSLGQCVGPPGRKPGPATVRLKGNETAQLDTHLGRELDECCEIGQGQLSPAPEQSAF